MGDGRVLEMSSNTGVPGKYEGVGHPMHYLFKFRVCFLNILIAQLSSKMFDSTKVKEGETDRACSKNGGEQEYI
jgi:hypothetical protein